MASTDSRIRSINIVFTPSSTVIQERISSMSLTILAALLALGSIKFSNSMSLGMYVFAIFILALSYFICELIISQDRGYTNVRIREDIITRKRRRGE